MIIKRRQFRYPQDAWDQFKKNCKNNGTDASSELHKFIFEFNKQHEFLNELEEINELAENKQMDEIKDKVNEMIKKLEAREVEE
ncbi:hypothetical protein [Halanaerobaculum tunisiense]